MYINLPGPHRSDGCLLWWHIIISSEINILGLLFYSHVLILFLDLFLKILNLLFINYVLHLLRWIWPSRQTVVEPDYCLNSQPNWFLLVDSHLYWLGHLFMPTLNLKVKKKKEIPAGVLQTSNYLAKVGII